MTASSAPVPVPDEVSQPFWSAINERRLVVQRCAECSEYHHPPVSICPDCLSVNLQFEVVSGNGHVRAFTRTYVARDPYFAGRAPYVVAIVELTESPDLLMVTNIPFDPAENVKIDAPVVVDFEEARVGQLIPQFRLVEWSE
jgi:uncharacterized protein